MMLNCKFIYFFFYIYVNLTKLMVIYYVYFLLFLQIRTSCLILRLSMFGSNRKWALVGKDKNNCVIDFNYDLQWITSSNTTSGKVLFYALVFHTVHLLFEH